jgi:hypothetical protein
VAAFILRDAASRLLRMRRIERRALLPSISNCQTARCMDVHHHSRCGVTARAQSCFSVSAPYRSGSFLLPQKEGAERHRARGVETVPIKHGDRPRPLPRTASPYGAPLRRLLGSRLGLGAPLPFDPDLAAFAAREGVRLSLGVCLTPGGRIQGRPGPRLRVVTAGAAPRSRQFRQLDVPQANGDERELRARAIGVNRPTRSEAKRGCPAHGRA